jgi:predicted PurR-regulated permease PerM
MPFLQTSQDRASFLILVLGAGILVALVPFLSGLMGAAVLYVIFVRPYRRLAMSVKPGFAAAMILITAVLLVALPVVWLVGLLIAEAPEALSRLQSSSQYARIGQMRIGSVQVGAEIAKASGTIVSWASSRLFAFVGGATSAILNLVIALFGFYYLLRSGGKLWATFRDYIPFSPHTAGALRDSFFSVTEATLLGTVLVAIVQGAIVGAGISLTGLPNPLFWGTVTAFASILPVLGSGLVWLPAAIILLVQGNYGGAIVMLVMGGGIASNIDNLIRPLVYKRVSNIHPMITIVGAFAGIRYFGLLGLLLGPLAIAYLFELLRFYRQDYSLPAADAPMWSTSTS